MNEPEIQNILDKYPRTNTYRFPVLEPNLTPSTIRHRIKNRRKNISKDISEIASELKNQDADTITFFWTRHTYATKLKRSGISNAIISEAACHSSEATTKAYQDKFEQTEIDNTYKHLV